MSSVLWDGNTLTQRWRQVSAELGHVAHEEQSGKVVLWLKDTRNVFGTSYGYVRGEEYKDMREAKEKAAASSAAFLMHLLWLRGLTETEEAQRQSVG